MSMQEILKYSEELEKHWNDGEDGDLFRFSHLISELYRQKDNNFTVEVIRAFRMKVKS